MKLSSHFWTMTFPDPEAECITEWIQTIFSSFSKNCTKPFLVLKAALFTKKFASHFLIFDFFWLCIPLRQKVAVPAVPVPLHCAYKTCVMKCRPFIVFLNDAWIRTLRAAVACKPACSLVTRLPFSNVNFPSQRMLSSVHLHLRLCLQCRPPLFLVLGMLWFVYAV